MSDWQEELKGRITRLEELPPGFETTEAERTFFARLEGRAKGGAALRFAVSRYYCSLAHPEDPEDPIRRQFLPRVQELEVRDFERTDPLEEARHRPVSRLVHRYRDRVLLLVTDRCGTYCRYCFRRHFASRREAEIGEGELAEAASWVGGHPEVEEVILSGGDPLTLTDDRLARVLESFRQVRSGLLLRIHTRLPVVLPSRVTDDLAARLGTFRPLWLVTQFNHPRELTPASGQALERLARAGVPLLNQCVLLKGINDQEEVLRELFRGLVRLGVKPYYLFHPDLARGTAHFRPSLDRGLALYRGLGSGLSGLARPVYALDLPDGGGKIRLAEGKTPRREGDWYLLESEGGEVYRYPAEPG